MAASLHPRRRGATPGNVPDAQEKGREAPTSTENSQLESGVVAGSVNKLASFMT